jgi:polyisoprenoid-binding protein YceI
MTSRYRLDPGRSRFTVQAFAGGLLSFLGHSPVFAVRQFAGSVSFDDKGADTVRAEITVRPDSLELTDAVSASDRREIETTMRRDVLETATFPEIVYRVTDAAAETISPGRYRLRLGGPLDLHGVRHPQRVDAELTVYPDGIALKGGCSLRLSDYRIRPVTALGGTIKLKDEVRLAFDVIGLPEVP